LVAWKDRLIDVLKRRRNLWWHTYHDARMLVLEHGFDSALGEVMATLYEVSEMEIEQLEYQIDVLASADYTNLLPIFRDQKRRRAA
jgi:hypothetical protein